jgi:hypothetical protein
MCHIFPFARLVVVEHNKETQVVRGQQKQQQHQQQQQQEFPLSVNEVGCPIVTRKYKSLNSKGRYAKSIKKKAV